METADLKNWAGEDWRNTWSPPEEQTRQGFTKAKYLTTEQIEGVLSELQEGTPIHFATRKYGTSSTQWMRKAHQDVELQKRSMEAIEEGKKAQQEDVYAMVWDSARNGSDKMREKLAIVLLPAFREALTTSRLQVGNIDGEALKLAALKQFGATLSDKDLATVIEIMERANQNELPPPTANGT